MSPIPDNSALRHFNLSASSRPPTSSHAQKDNNNASRFGALDPSVFLQPVASTCSRQKSASVNPVSDHPKRSSPVPPQPRTSLQPHQDQSTERRFLLTRPTDHLRQSPDLREPNPTRTARQPTPSPPPTPSQMTTRTPRPRSDAKNPDGLRLPRNRGGMDGRLAGGRRGGRLPSGRKMMRPTASWGKVEATSSASSDRDTKSTKSEH